MKLVRDMRAAADAKPALPPGDGHPGGGLARRSIMRGGAIAAGILAAGALGESAAWARPKRIMAARQTPHDARVVVIGAGLAGLTCAYRLAQHGVSCQLFEARDARVGGRCWSARMFEGGQVAEHGGEFIDTRHVQLRRLAAELGLVLDDRFKARPRGGKSVLYLQGAVRDPNVVYRDFPQVLKRLTADVKRIGPITAFNPSRACIALDEMSARDWIDAHVPGGPSSLLASAIADGLANFFGGNPEDLSALNLHASYVLAPPGADDRYHIRGGNDQVPNLVAKRLPAGTVRMAAPLQAVRRTGRRYELSFGGIPAPVTADMVVFALPFTALRRTDLSRSGLSARKLEAIQNHGMGTNAKVLMQFSKRFEKMHGWSGSLSSDNPRWDSWASSTAEPGTEGLLTIYSGGSAGASYPVRAPHGPATPLVVRESLALLRKLIPGSAAAFNRHAWTDSWVDDPWTHGSYASFLPGQYTKYWGYTAIPEGALHFAGELTSTYSQGYLNGGVESGERAAREILAGLGR